MKAFIIFARIITGAAFLFSGFVKAVDPLGSAYKFQDYFHAFNMEFLSFMSLPLAVILCTAEFISGFTLLTGIRQKEGISVIMLLMIIFTPLTFILALTNPVSDCGCFGDAVHLTNWQTFGKNIILIILAVFLFINRKNVVNLIRPFKEWMILSVTAVVFILFCLYNLRYLPVIDFLPYQKGVKIAEKMVVPENAPADVYNTTFIYEKEGIRKEFSIDNYPADDTTWKFIDQKSVLVKKGYVPPVHDFSITCNGEDVTQKILDYKGFTVLMVAKKLSEADNKHLSDGFEFGRHCMNKGIGFYVLTASGAEEVMNYKNNTEICSADETTLKTMIRSNPGFMLLNNGTIIDKWSWANLPDSSSFDRLIRNIF